MDITELRFDLDAWASWKASNSGSMPNACNLGRLMEATGGGVPGSRPPPGVEIPRRRLAALIEGMEILPLFQDIGESLMVVRLIYMRDRNRSIEDVAEALGMSMTRLKAHRRAAETCLLGWMIARGY